MSKIKVVQDPEKEIPKEILAKAIVRISESFAELKKSGVNEKGIIALIHDDTKISKTEIRLMLNSLSTLSTTYCNK
jgi:hypothetical protein